MDISVNFPKPLTGKEHFMSDVSGVEESAFDFDSVIRRSRENPKMTYVVIDNSTDKRTGHFGVLGYLMKPNEVFSRGYHRARPPVAVFNAGISIKLG